ncbi:unnamed protein product [Prorocentrum cordatum]|nr:unnamed protein product [Polarella glacialis]
MLFFVQHLLKGFVASLSIKATPFLYRSYHLPGPQIQIYGSVSQLPWSMKPIIGLLSDVMPIGGYNKAPYIVLTSLAGGIAFATLGWMPQSSLPVNALVACMFLKSLQLSTCDLLSEAKYAEKMQQAPQHGPSLMTYVWFGLALGGLVATLLSGPIIHSFGPKHRSIDTMAQVFLAMQVARATILELARGISTGAALWGATHPCPTCAPVVYCPAVPASTCVCPTPSPLAVAGGALLVALLIVGAYLLGALWGLPTREVRVVHSLGSQVAVTDDATALRLAAFCLFRGLLVNSLESADFAMAELAQASAAPAGCFMRPRGRGGSSAPGGRSGRSADCPEVSGRSAQAAYYQSLDGHNMLPDVFVKYHVMNQQGDAADVHVRRSAATVLTNCKINEEYTDPLIVLCLRIIDKVRAKSFERRMAAAVCATINGRSFLKELLKKLVGEGWTGAQFWETAHTLVHNIDPEQLFTGAFNKQALESKSKRELANKRLIRIRDKMNQDINFDNASRLQVSLDLVKVCGKFLGKNAFSLLEQSYANRCRRPGWCSQRGALMGPGAVAGVNIISGMWKQSGTGSAMLGDALQQWDESHDNMEELRRLFRNDLNSLRTLARKSRGEKRALAGELCDALEHLLGMSDTGLQFVCCEIAEVVAFHYNLHKRCWRLSKLRGDVGNAAGSEGEGDGRESDDDD